MASRLTQPQKKALQELKKLIRDSLNSYDQLTGEVTIWGVPLLGDDQKSDLVMIKFLRAADFKVLDAFEKIKTTLRWRNEVEVGVESVLGEDLGCDCEKVIFTHGYDKDGYPVWYLVLEECLNSNLCQNMPSDIEKQDKFLHWLIWLTENNVRQLDFSSASRSSFVLVIDLKGCPWYENLELYKVINRFLELLSDNYPGLLAKQIWINAPWWYRTYCRAYSIVFDEWSTNKVVYSGSTKSVEILFRYICPGQVPVKFGGLSRDDKQQSGHFTASDAVTEVTIKPASKHSEEFSFAEECEVVWELRVIGWDVSYEAKFIPSMKGRYMTIISSPRKLTSSDESVISNCFRVNEPGKLVILIHNATLKKKKLLTRFRTMKSETDCGDEPSLCGWLQSDSYE